MNASNVRIAAQQVARHDRHATGAREIRKAHGLSAVRRHRLLAHDMLAGSRERFGEGGMHVRGQRQGRRVDGVEIELVEGGERPCANGPRLFCAAREGIHQRDDLMA